MTNREQLEAWAEYVEQSNDEGREEEKAELLEKIYDMLDDGRPIANIAVDMIRWDVDTYHEMQAQP